MTDKGLETILLLAAICCVYTILIPASTSVAAEPAEYESKAIYECSARGLAVDMGRQIVNQKLKEFNADFKRKKLDCSGLAKHARTYKEGIANTVLQGNYELEVVARCLYAVTRLVYVYKCGDWWVP